MVLWGRSVLGCQKVPRKVPPRFRGRFRQGSTKVLPRIHQGSTKRLQVSWCLWFSEQDPSWAAKRFRARFHQGSAEGSAKVPPRFRQGFTKVSPRFHQGSTKVPPSFSKFRGVSGSLSKIRLGLPKGSTKVLQVS